MHACRHSFVHVSTYIYSCYCHKMMCHVPKVKKRKNEEDDDEADLESFEVNYVYVPLTVTVLVSFCGEI